MSLKSYMRGLGIGIVVTAVLMGIGNENKDVALAENDAGSVVLSDMAELSEDAKTLEDEMKKSSSSSAVEVADEKTSSSSVKDASDEKSSSSSVKDVSDEKSSSSSVKDVSDEKSSSSSVKDVSDEKSSSSSVKEVSDEKSSSSSVKDIQDEKSSSSSIKEKAESEIDKLQTTVDLEDDGQKKNSTPKEGTLIEITVTSGQGSYAIAKACENAGIVENAEAFDKYLGTYGYDRKLTTGVHKIPAGSTEAQIAQILTSSTK